MNIFQEVKERVTARQVAERYGLKVRCNGMACCPFHNDKHPSMKIDQNYYCFACGAKGVQSIMWQCCLDYPSSKQRRRLMKIFLWEFQSEKRRKEENKIQVAGKKRRFRQKRNGFNLFKRKLINGRRMLKMYCYGICDGWIFGRSFTSRNLWKRNGIRYLPKPYRIRARLVIWWTC